MAEYLFVCGTLLPELAPPAMAPLMDSLTPLDQASVAGRLYDLGAYPGAVLDPASPSRVRGRVFRLPSAGAFLAALDDYEGVDPNDVSASRFIRVKVDAVLAAGETLQSWMYVFNGDPGDRPLVPDGDYLTYVANRSTQAEPAIVE